MKFIKFLIGVFTLMISILVTAQPTMVDICHYSASTGTYSLISVASSSVPSHLAHGDALPGDPVPTNPGYIFDAACNQVPVYVSTCPCDLTATALNGVGINTGNPGVCYGTRVNALFEEIVALDLSAPNQVPFAGIFHEFGVGGVCIVESIGGVIDGYTPTDSQAVDCKIDISAAIAELMLPECNSTGS